MLLPRAHNSYNNRPVYITPKLLLQISAENKFFSNQSPINPGAQITLHKEPHYRLAKMCIERPLWVGFCRFQPSISDCVTCTKVPEADINTYVIEQGDASVSGMVTHRQFSLSHNNKYCEQVRKPQKLRPSLAPISAKPNSLPLCSNY